MSEILEKIRGMNQLEKVIFFDLLFENKSSNLAIILNYVDEKTREVFYKELPEHITTLLKIETANPTNKAEIRSIEKEILTLFDKVHEKTEEAKKYQEKHTKMIRESRKIMKSTDDTDFYWISDQGRGIEPPPPQKEYDSTAEIIDLPPPDTPVLKNPNISDCIKDRKSRRTFTDEYLTMEELSYLLWATQGVRKVFPDRRGSFRTVPSGGARNPFETYVAVQHVKNIKKGVYRYLPFEHKLLYLFSDEKMPEILTRLAWGQSFVGKSAVCFIWSTIPYRTEWRYGLKAKKDILQESGHVCQNLYLACESILCGTCAVGAYDQEGLDHFLRLDGEEEFVIYLAPVGRVKSERNTK